MRIKFNLNDKVSGYDPWGGKNYYEICIKILSSFNRPSVNHPKKLQVVQDLDGFVFFLQAPNVIPPRCSKCLVKEMENFVCLLCTPTEKLHFGHTLPLNLTSTRQCEHSFNFENTLMLF